MSSEFAGFLTSQLHTQLPFETGITPPFSTSIRKISEFDRILEKYEGTPSSISSDYIFSIFGSDLDPRRHISIQQILTHRNSSLYNFEYYVKLVGKSYRNLMWVTEKFVLDNGGQSKLKEYTKLHPTPPPPPYYDPDYEKIEKILGRRNGNEYLVKWCKLDYEQSTWETPATIQDDSLISHFLRAQISPLNQEIPPKPNPNQWKKIHQSPVSKTGLIARNYQVDGLNFLTNCWYHNRNCILADEMGLGKTLQSILFLNTLRNQEKIHGPFLIVVPLSTVTQWNRELIEWSDFQPLVFIGDQIKRTIMKAFEFYYENTKIPKFEVLLTTYECIIRDPELSLINWQCIIIDEAHRLKNSESKLLKIFRSYQASFKILLTGTPIQNKTQELWSLLNFLDPLNFNSLTEFESKFGNCNEMSAVHEIQNILRPIMLRRLKSDVEKAIAPLEEVIIDCPMTMHQKAYYKAIFMKNLAYLTRGAHSKTNSSCLRNISMDLRKVCNHPYLLKNAEEQILIERREAMKDIGPNEYIFVNESLIRSSGKMILLDKLLTKLKADGHRVLIFSQMQKMLDILTDYLNYKNYKFERIDGSIRSKDRQNAIDKFNDPNSQDFVFLLCTKAGGVGINLTTADTVIIYDSDWNPQNDIQATARCHRIGQTKDVKAYRFITANSYERKMFETASMKLGLDKAVLESSKIHNQEDMDKLIRLGAYHALEDDSAEIEQFGEEDIENIISRSQRIKHENVNGESTFSKAEFKIEDESVPVALYKPEFWKKYVPENETSPYLHYDDDYSDSSKDRKNINSNSHFDLLDYVFDSDEDDNQLHADPEYWNRDRIQSLMYQLVRLGFNKWDKIINNCELTCDQNEVKAVSRVILGWLLLNTEEDSLLNDLYQEMQSKSTSSFEKNFTKKKKNDLKQLFLDEDNWRLKRIELLYCVDRLVSTCPSVPDEIVVPEIDKSPPTTWWEKKHDQQLLYYVSQNGIQQLGKMHFEGHQEESIPKKILLSRLNLITTVLIESFNQYKNNHKNETVLFCHDVLNKSVTYWSPKDQKTVIRFLLLYGYPNAEKFKFISGLRNKNEANIDQFVKEIIGYCQAVQSISKSSKSKNANETTDDLTNEYDESTTVDSTTDASELPIIEQNNFIVQPISRAKALQILSRCKFFEKVREFVRADSKSLTESEKNLIQYVAERGFLNPSESQAIHAEFGETPTDTKVIKRIENMDRAFFGKKTLRNVNSIQSQNNVLLEIESSQKVDSPLVPNSTVTISEKYEFRTDENGQPILPISLSTSLVLVSLGKIVYNRPNFHTKRYIYTDGFVSEHLYSSVKDPKEKVWYRSLIIDKGGENPVFRVQLKSDPKVHFDGNSPSNPWLTIFRIVSEKKGNGQKGTNPVTVSGPEFYGLSHPITNFLIRHMENAKKCQSEEFPKIRKMKVKKIDLGSQILQNSELNDDLSIQGERIDHEYSSDNDNLSKNNSERKFIDDDQIYSEKVMKPKDDVNPDMVTKSSATKSDTSLKQKKKKSETDKPKKKKALKKSKQSLSPPPSQSISLKPQPDVQESESDELTETNFNAPYPLILDFSTLISKAKAIEREDDAIFAQFGYE